MLYKRVANSDVSLYQSVIYYDFMLYLFVHILIMRYVIM